MRTPFDRFAKEAWSAILERAARVETEAEVAADVQFVDLTYEPDPTKLAALEPFGLVARMVKEGPGLLEFFHSAPTVHDVLCCSAFRSKSNVVASSGTPPSIPHRASGS